MNVEECKIEAGPNFRARMKCEDMDPEYFINEAKSIVRELSGSHTSPAYIQDEAHSIRNGDIFYW